MTNEEIIQIVKNVLPDCEIQVEERQGQYIVHAIGDVFNDTMMIDRQKKIYAPLAKYITEGKIHAISVRGYTKEEWANTQNKQ